MNFIAALCNEYHVTLLSPSIREIRAMISLYEIFTKNFDVAFNCKNMFI